MYNKKKKKPRSNRSIIRTVIVVLIGVAAIAVWLWSFLCDVPPRLNYILVNINNEPLKLLNGELLHVSPKDRLRILKVYTNLCYKGGVRLVAKGIDVNATLFEEISISNLLPEGRIYDKYNFRVEVKKRNDTLGHLDILIEPKADEWLERAARLINHDRRIELLQKALTFFPEDNRLRSRLAESYKALEKWEDAALMVERIVLEQPSKKNYLDLLGLYQSIPDPEGIINTLRKIIQLEPDNPQARLDLIKALEESGKYQDAISEYKALLELNIEDLNLPIYKSLGYLYTEIKDIDNAISMYSKAAELDITDADIRYNLSLLYEQKGQKKLAEQFLKETVKLRSGDLDSHIKLADKLISQGKYKEAETHLKEIIKQKPDSTEAMLLAISVYEKIDNKKALKDIYSRLYKIDPSNSTLLFNLGVLEYETENWTKSLNHFKKFAGIHKDDTEVHRYLLDLYIRLKKDDLIFKEAVLLAGVFPKDKSLYPLIFRYLNTRGQYKKIIETMKEALKSLPGATFLREYLVVAFLKTGKEESALKEMQQILKIQPKNLKLLNTIAELLDKLGKPKELLDIYKKTAIVSPKDIALLHKIAKLQEDLEMPKDALNTYKTILDISPNNEKAEEAYLKLRLKVLAP